MENIMLAHMKIFSLSLQFLNTISVVYDKKKKKKSLYPACVYWLYYFGYVETSFRHIILQTALLVACYGSHNI